MCYLREVLNNACKSRQMQALGCCATYRLDVLDLVFHCVFSVYDLVYSAEHIIIIRMSAMADSFDEDSTKSPDLDQVFGV